MTILDQYTSACNFPGTIDKKAVERALAMYCSALGIKRRIVKITQGWNLSTYPELTNTVYEILTDFEKRRRKPKALAARAARDALAALDALADRDAHDARAALDARAAQWERGVKAILDIVCAIP